MTTMTPLKACVKNGRLVLDEPTDLPEGEVIELVPLEEPVPGQSPHPRCLPHPDDEADVRAGLEEARRGEGVRLTPEQVAQWASTGEFPWLESSSSRRDT
jgi:hypothetical protein